MRLPNLSPAIDRRRPGSPPAGLGPGAVSPRGEAHFQFPPPTCSGTCSATQPCANPGQCQCNNGQCTLIQPVAFARW